MGRAGDHPTPSVSIEADGEFERVLGCQVNRKKWLGRSNKNTVTDQGETDLA